MKNTFGINLTITIYGESHGTSVGCILDGIAPGIPVDEEEIRRMLSLRRPSGDISTSRRENDEFIIQSGVYNGYTTGTPICIVIPNNDTRSKDYENISHLARPSHADYTAHVKYRGFEDYRGGGHFSGRITAALVAVGGIIIPALRRKGIYVGTHLKKCAGVSDREFSDMAKDINELNYMPFPVLDKSASEKIQTKILEAKSNGDSVGGMLETAVIGIDAGLGEPWFDTVEGLLSHALFSIPAVKGVAFGAGFELADMCGSKANDEFCAEDGKVYTKTNRSGGINGGITNGMPIVFTTAIRPTPTIAKQQSTIDYVNLTDAEISASGRHDPCIAHRAKVVVDCVTALVIADLLSGKYGVDWLAL